MNENSQYFMEDPREKDRLKEKVDPKQWVEQYYAPHLCADCDVLDVGCGPGVIAAEIGKSRLDTKVVGFDGSTDRATEARRNFQELPNCEFVMGDAHQLPFKDQSFDFVYSRFLVEYLKDKPRAIAEMVRVLRPGGTLLVQDLDGQLVWHWPPDPKLEDDIQKVLEALAKTGFDPFVGRKLFYLMRGAGCRELEVKVGSYHLFPGRIDSTNDALWDLKLGIAIGVLREALGDNVAAQQLKTRFMEYLRREDSLSYSTIFTVVGTK